MAERVKTEQQFLSSNGPAVVRYLEEDEVAGSIPALIP